MKSKRAPDEKRTPMPRPSDYTKLFAKDWTRLSHSGRYDMNRLKDAMLLLIANNSPLGPEWKDHQLAGEWKDHRECHIGGDFLLVYKLSSRGMSQYIIFVRTGTHAELFE